MTLSARLCVGFAVIVGVMACRHAEAQLPIAEKKPQQKPIAAVKLPDWGTSVVFSPDGKTVAIGTYEKVLLVETESGKELRQIKVRSGYARGLDWSPDGALLATGSYGAVELWNAESGEQVQTMKSRGYANDVRFSPDGATIAAAGEDGVVRRWNVADAAELEPLKGLRDPVQGVAFSADGTLLAAAAGDDTRLTRSGSVKIWKVADGTEPVTIEVMPERCATAVAFSPDGQSLFVSDFNDRVTVYDPSTGQARGFFGQHTRPVNSVVTLEDGKTVISGSGGLAMSGNDIKIWNAADGDELATIEHHTAKVARIAVSADETRLASVSADKTAAVWDLAAMIKPPTEPAPETAQEKGFLEVVADALTLAPAAGAVAEADKPKVLRIGVIGLDTSHAVEFTKIINQSTTGPLSTCRVVAAYPKGSPDIESSVSRVPQYTEDVKAQGVEIVDSIEALLEKVDCVLLETNDGRPHLEQALPVLAAHKPVFIDKPLAGSLADCVAIFEAAKHYGTPCFSSSSLRYTEGAQAARNGSVGAVLGCDAFSPCHLEATHPDLFWYGIHGVEELFTAMGTGCESVSRTSTADFDVAVGTWKEGRIGTFRGIRKGGSGYGGTVFGEKGIAPLGDYGGYAPLVLKIVEFFHSGEPPVSAEETLEVYAFMAAADASKQNGGQPVTLESVMQTAREEAGKALAGRLKPPSK